MTPELFAHIGIAVASIACGGMLGCLYMHTLDQALRERSQAQDRLLDSQAELLTELLRQVERQAAKIIRQCESCDKIDQHQKLSMALDDWAERGIGRES